MVRLSAFVRENAGLVVSGLVLIVLLAGFAYSLHLGDRLRYPDEESYTTIARNLVVTSMYTLDGVHPTAYRPPGYPFLLAAVDFSGGNVPASRIVNYIALSVAIALLFGITRRQHGPLAGLLAAVMAICYPVVFYTAGTLYPQTVATLMLVIVLWLYFGERELNVWRAAGVGVVSGLLILTVPTFAFLLLFVGGWEFCEKRWKCFKSMGVVALSAVLTLSPWLVRNRLVFDSTVFVSSNSGINLLLGNSENTTPNAGVNVDISAYRARAGGMNEIEQNRFYTGEAVRYVLRNPVRSARLYARKFLNYFNYRNQLRISSESSTARDAIMLLTYGIVLLLAAVRLVLAARFPLSRYERFVFLLYLLNGAFAAIFFTRIRFRLPFDLLLISVSAIFLSRIVESILDGQAAADGSVAEGRRH